MSWCLHPSVCEKFCCDTETVGSECGMNSMKGWIHPAIYRSIPLWTQSIFFCALNCLIRYELIWVVRKLFFSDDKQQMQIFRINAASGAASLVIFKCIEKSCLDPWICIKTPCSSAEVSFTSNAIVFAVLPSFAKNKNMLQQVKIVMQGWCSASSDARLLYFTTNSAAIRGKGWR